MEALSKASGAETAVGEGDKRRAEPGAGSCYGRAPLPSLRGEFKGRRGVGGGDGEWAERWMRCLSDPLCLCPPFLAWDVFIPAVEREPSQYLMMRMVISLPALVVTGGENRGCSFQTRCRWKRVATGKWLFSLQRDWSWLPYSFFVNSALQSVMYLHDMSRSPFHPQQFMSSSPHFPSTCR